MPIAAGTRKVRRHRPAFVPWLSLAGCYAWFNSSAIPPVADATLITAWPDSSGHGRTATAAGTTRPQYKTNVVGTIPAVFFDSGQVMQTASIAHGIGTGDFTWVAIGLLTDLGGLRTPLANGEYSPAFYLSKAGTPTVHSSGTDLPFTTGATALSTVYVAILKREGGAFTLRMNGATDVIVIPNADSMADAVLNIGAEDTAGESPFYGRLFDAGAFNRALTLNEMIQIERWAA